MRGKLANISKNITENYDGIIIEYGEDELKKLVLNFKNKYNLNIVIQNQKLGIPDVANALITGRKNHNYLINKFYISIPRYAKWLKILGIEILSNIFVNKIIEDFFESISICLGVSLGSFAIYLLKKITFLDRDECELLKIIIKYCYDNNTNEFDISSFGDFNDIYYILDSLIEKNIISKSTKDDIYYIV